MQAYTVHKLNNFSCLFYFHAPYSNAGNLLRAGDTRGYNSMAKMYTKDYASELK